jgi:hypothetical protein
MVSDITGVMVSENSHSRPRDGVTYSIPRARDGVTHYGFLPPYSPVVAFLLG